MKLPEVVCNTKDEYIEVALALQTLMHHNMNYLWTGDQSKISEEILVLLHAALEMNTQKKGGF